MPTNWPDSAPWMMRWSYVEETFITREMPSVESASSGMAWNSAG